MVLCIVRYGRAWISCQYRVNIECKLSLFFNFATKSAHVNSTKTIYAPLPFDRSRFFAWNIQWKWTIVSNYFETIVLAIALFSNENDQCIIDFEFVKKL